MSEVLDELRTTVARVAGERFGPPALRTLRADPAPRAAVLERWRELAGLGWTGLLLPEAVGGAGVGLTEAAVVLHGLGAALAVTPVLASGVHAATVLAQGESEAWRSAAAGVAEGSRIVVLADGSAHPGADGFTATAVDGGWHLTGERRFVPFASVADQVVLTTATGAFLVDLTDVEVVPGRLIDGQPVAHLRFAGLVGADRALPDAADVLATARLRTAVAHAAVMAGGQRRALALTVTYLREREQFGVPIGAFQALQHRAADLFAAAEVSDAVATEAARALDAGAPTAARLAHAAAATVSAAYERGAEEGLQIHGGIGMTDDAEIGFHLKAAKVAEQQWGDPAHHRRQFAEASGY